MKALKRVGAGLAVVALIVLGLALYVEIDGVPRYATHPPDLHVTATPERVARGKALAGMLCAECHRDQATGVLSGKEMIDTPPEFGSVHSANITQDPKFGIANWSDGEIAFLLRTGIKRDGHYAPPWMIKLPFASDEDIASIVAFLRSDDALVKANATPTTPCQPSFLLKALMHGPFKPLPFPDHAIAQPDVGDKLAVGRYYVVSFGCAECHSADFKTNDAMHPEQNKGFLGGGNALRDATGATVHSANITFDDATGIGKWAPADLRKAIREGFRPDASPVRYPMPLFPELTDDEIDSVFAYLKSQPAIVNAVPHPAAPIAGTGPLDGKTIYRKYACNACHGDTGAGSCDLRAATKKYPTDDALRAFVERPIAVVPDSKMPAWRGVIRDEEYEPLLVYVRTLGSN